MAADEFTKRCWAISEGLGRPPSEAKKVSETILDELTAAGTPRGVALEVAAHVKIWKETKNPYYMDKAFLFLAKHGGTPSETMLAEDLAVRTARYNGSLSGTADSIENDDAEWAALVFMANLIFRGMAMKQASWKAAHYYSFRFPELKRKKASTLERYYAQKIRAAGFEEDFFRAWHRIHSEPEWERQWEKIARGFTDCPDDLIGNARD